LKKCKSCGEEYKKEEPICPKCGEVGGPQAITDLPGSGVKEARKELLGEIKETQKTKEKMLEASCRSCGTKVYENLDVCPSCGEAGGIQAITDLPKLHLREAHRKLKEEIREAKEKEPEED
jgi:uncharacterized OB-fold protein